MSRLIASVSAADDFVVDDESATWGASGDGNTLFYVSTEDKSQPCLWWCQRDFLWYSHRGCGLVGRARMMMCCLGCGRLGACFYCYKGLALIARDDETGVVSP